MSLKDFINEKNSVIAQLFANKPNYVDFQLKEGNITEIAPRISYNYDPLQVLDFLEYKSKPIGLSYDFLKMITDRDPLVAAIIATRLSQLMIFSRPKYLSRSRFGFSFVPLVSESIKEPEKKVIRELENFIYNCGFYPDFTRWTFPTFLKAIIRDRFRYDQVNFEIVYNKDLGIPVAFYAVDSSTIRKYPPKKITIDKTYYQQIQGLERVNFGYAEMAWGIYFPRTDIDNYGFGLSEVEQILHIIASRVYAEEYNSNFLKRGISKGILWAKRSTISRSKMQSLREEMSASAGGWYNAHRIPFIFSPDIENLQYISLDKSLRDMEFGKYLDYLLNLCCAVFQIDPSEVNFPNRSNISGAVVQTEGSQEVKIKFSRDKGLKPLLMYIEDLINQYLIFPLTNMEWAFVFHGLDDVSEKEALERKQREVTNWKTVNEIRAEEGLPPIEEGDVILNSTFLQLFMQEQARGGEMPRLHIKEQKPIETPPPKTEEETAREDIPKILERLIGKSHQ